MECPQPIFVGYRVKRITRAPFDLRERATHYGRLIKEIASVSDCQADPPDGWESRVDLNRAGCCATPEAAESAIPRGEKALFAQYAYEVFPLQFDGEGAALVNVQDFLGAPPSSFPVGPPADGYAFIGYDLVNIRPDWNDSAPPPFPVDCSPLTCNDMAAQCRANRYCLLDSWEEVVAVAARFTAEHAEPGPYYAFAVYRRDVK